MDNIIINSHGDNADASLKSPYSAQELAEIYLKSRHDFLTLDLEEVTCNWNSNYIFEFLYYIRDVNLFNVIIEWFLECWKKKHGFYMSFDRTINKDLVHELSELGEKLRLIKEKTIERFESEKHTEELRARLMAGYRQNETYTLVEHQGQVTESTVTQKPSFEGYNQVVIPEYYISDLTEESQNILLVTDDQVFSELTDISRNLLWPWIKKNNLKSANVVRFIFRYKGFIARKTSVLKFTNLFNQMVPEAQLKADTVSDYEDANNDDFEKYNKLEEWKQFKRDGEAVIKILQPVINSLQSAQDNPKNNN